jgi:hypothetical protein
MGRPDLCFIVMGGGIVIAAYRGPRAYEIARRHSRCITGTGVEPLDISQLPEAMRALVYAELRTELPEDVLRDIETSEWEETEEVTPIEPIELEVDDLDDP